jgi:hypothetical protein
MSEEEGTIVDCSRNSSTLYYCVHNSLTATWWPLPVLRDIHNNSSPRANWLAAV